jgi:hypothetical protein
MPRFDTPGPILVTVDIGVGDVRINATSRTDTFVDVRPTDPSKKADVAAAQQTRVEFSDGRLLVKGPKGWRRYSLRGGGESIDVQIDLPLGSQLRGEAGIAALHCTGALGECHYTTGVGDVHVEEARPVHLTTGAGDIAVDRAGGHAQIVTGSGAVRIGSVEGTAEIKGSNGSTWVGDISKDLRVVAANGSINVDHSHATVVAKTVNGDVSLGDVEGGTVVAHTAMGRVDIGVREGVAAWLDLDTKFGKVYNDLDPGARPQPGEQTVEVRARTSFGDITVHRAVTTAPATASR